MIFSPYCDAQHRTMIGVWIFITLASSALAQEANLDELFNNEISVQADKKHSGVYGDLDKGCHDCYKCDDPLITARPRKTSKLRLVDAQGQTTNLCCLPQFNLQARIGDDCGKMKAGGILVNGRKQKKTHVRATLVGEYPWRAWIWKRGEARPFCAGVVIDTEIVAVVTSASCALKYPANSLVMSFDRTLRNPIDVGDLVVNDGYDKDEPLVNDIALLFRDATKNVKAPGWARSACVSNLPPMQATYCMVMSKEDYFIDTVVMEQKKCEVDKKEPHVSQMCTAVAKGDYMPEIGAGLFCQDRLRTQTNEYYVSGITLKVSDQVVAYTNVSFFEQWINDKVLERTWPANQHHHHHHHYGN